LRYATALMSQMAQTAVGSRHHSLDQQLSRWLLLRLDRLSGSELVTAARRGRRSQGKRVEGGAAVAA
jgi:hypothetical protein